MNRFIKIAVLPFIALIFSQWAIAEGDILPYWQTQMQHIEKGLNDVQQHYQQGNKENALEISKMVHFTHYRNSDLESAIRINSSMQSAEELNQAFFKISKLIADDADHTQEVNALAKQLKVELHKALPDLPLTPKLLRQQAAHLAQKEAERIEKKDYHDDISALNNTLTQVVSDYRAGKKNLALTSIQDNFYRYWQRSDLAASVSVDYKQSIEHTFDDLYKSIAQNKPVADVQQRVQQLTNALQKNEQYKVRAHPKNKEQWHWIAVCLAGLLGIGAVFVSRRRAKKTIT